MLEENISKYRINSSYLWILDFFFVYFYFPNILRQTCGTLVTIKLSYISTSQVGNKEGEKWGQTVLSASLPNTEKWESWSQKAIKDLEKVSFTPSGMEDGET